MKPKHPIETAVFVLLLVAFNCWIAPASSALFPAELRSGELWRLFTYPWAHISAYHLLLDAAAFLCLYDMLRCKAPTRLFHLCSCILFSGLVPVLLDPRLPTVGLRGLSGVAHGLVIVTSLEAVRSKTKSERYFGWIILAGVCAKCLVELATGTVLFANYHLGNVGIPIPTCHVGGALGGLISYGLVALAGARQPFQFLSLQSSSSDSQSPAPKSPATQFPFRTCRTRASHLPT
ncbi:MAG TPA: rhombosortase [Verrucomicrobiae bacterium]